MKKFLICFLVVLFSISVIGQEPGTFKDPRDGKSYKTVKIGSFTIMAENLAYKPNKGNYWAYDNNQGNVAAYGYLYDYFTALSIAPQGWHLPSKDEWEAITTALGSDGKAAYQAMKPGGSSGFNGVLSGYYFTDGTFSYLKDAAYFWSATPSGETKAFYLRLSSGYAAANIAHSARGCGFSVRLVKD